MNRILFFLVVISLSLGAVDTDFDGVEDDVDLCLGTDILDTVTADGCSEKQKKAKEQSKSSKEKYEVSLVQTLSSLKAENQTSIDNYGLSLILAKESWLFYVGSGYFKYDNSIDTIEDFSDTILLAQKTFRLSSKHYLKSSLSSTLPTYNTDGNKIDYGATLSYVYLYKKIDVEMGYQYDMINDDNAFDIHTGYLYLSYALSNSIYGSLGYRKDNLQREDKSILLQYDYSSHLSLSYIFTKSKNNFYDTMHSFGVGYRF